MDYELHYDLHEAAALIHVDVKTLRHWIERTGIDLVVDPLDRRRRLIAAEQLTSLTALYHRTTFRSPVIRRAEGHVMGNRSYVSLAAHHLKTSAQSGPDRTQPSHEEWMVSLETEVERALDELRSHLVPSAEGVTRRLQLLESRLKVLSTILAHIAGLPENTQPESILMALRGDADPQAEVHPATTNADDHLSDPTT